MKRWKVERIEKNCLECNKGFLTIESRIKKGRGKYCSKRCASIAILRKYGLLEGNPNNRGRKNSFYGKHHTEEIKKYLSEINEGKNNPGWRGGVQSDYSKASWHTLASWIRGRDKCTCVRCKKCGRVVHHMIPIRLKGTNDAFNLITVCQPCHGYIENKVVA